MIKMTWFCCCNYIWPFCVDRGFFILIKMLLITVTWAWLHGGVCKREEGVDVLMCKKIFLYTYYFLVTRLLHKMRCVCIMNTREFSEWQHRPTTVYTKLWNPYSSENNFLFICLFVWFTDGHPTWTHLWENWLELNEVFIKSSHLGNICIFCDLVFKTGWIYYEMYHLYTVLPFYNTV